MTWKQSRRRHCARPLPGRPIACRPTSSTTTAWNSSWPGGCASAPRAERLSLYGPLYDELFRRVPNHPQLTRKVSEAERRAASNDKFSLLARFIDREHRVPGNRRRRLRLHDRGRRSRRAQVLCARRVARDPERRERSEGRNGAVGRLHRARARRRRSRWHTASRSWNTSIPTMRSNSCAISSPRSRPAAHTCASRRAGSMVRTTSRSSSTRWRAVSISRNTPTRSSRSCFAPWASRAWCRTPVSAGTTCACRCRSCGYSSGCSSKLPASLAQRLGRKPHLQERARDQPARDQVARVSRSLTRAGCVLGRGVFIRIFIGGVHVDARQVVVRVDQVAAARARRRTGFRAGRCRPRRRRAACGGARACRAPGCRWCC